MRQAYAPRKLLVEKRHDATALAGEYVIEWAYEIDRERRLWMVAVRWCAGTRTQSEKIVLASPNDAIVNGAIIRLTHIRGGDSTIHVIA